MSRSTLSVVFAGSGGSGAMTAGTVFLRSAARAGYYGLMTQLFGAQVRGGESAALVQLSTEPVECQPDRFDLFLALDWKKVDQFAAEIPLDQHSIVIADPVAGNVPDAIAKSKARIVSMSMSDPNMTRQSNADALESGIKATSALGLDFKLKNSNRADRWLITGNEAISLGALRAGVRFVGCYPITPATDLVEWLAPELQKLGGRLVLAEDELAAVNMAVGASYGGVPAMMVTSGPGLSLMGETIGLSVAAEIPLLVVDVMRAGPSTGIPSKTEQSDVNIAIHGGHGDAPRVVLSPLSVGDCMVTAEWAVYIAESLQTLIVLSDQAMGQAQLVIDATLKRPTPLKRRVNGVASPTQFKRYGISPDPITAMPRPQRGFRPGRPAPVLRAIRAPDLQPGLRRTDPRRRSDAGAAEPQVSRLSPGRDARACQAVLAAERKQLAAATRRAPWPRPTVALRVDTARGSTLRPYREESLFYMGAGWPTLRRLALELWRRLVAALTLRVG